MKVSISLPENDIAFVDEYAESHPETNRSAVIRKALKLLRESELDSAYEEAFSEWEESGEAGIWDRAAGDGLEDPYEAR